METSATQIDLHRLELRYAATRLVEPQAVERLARSIEQSGQLIPCIGVAATNGERVVLLDGYRRVAALRRLGRDTVYMERWNCDLAQGLITVLCRTQARAFAAIEEALLLRGLIDELGLKQGELARRCGRDISWVCRRLQLLSGLPEGVLEAVRAGVLSTWGATRVVGPLARANAEHAERLLANVRDKALSTRELNCWFAQYQQASHATRERLIAYPQLFLKALAEKREARALEGLRAGPEGECAADLRALEAISVRLRKRLCTLAEEGLPEALQSAAVHLRSTLEVLLNELKSYSEHDQRGNLHGGAHAQSPGLLVMRDQPHAQACA
jgi:ParB family chromosome partitioning protein